MLETGGPFKVFIRVTRRTGRMLAKANAFTQIFYSLRGRRLKAGRERGFWARGKREGRITRYYSGGFAVKCFTELANGRLPSY